MDSVWSVRPYSFESQLHYIEVRNVDDMMMMMMIVVVDFILNILELHFVEVQVVTAVIPALLPPCNIRKYVTHFKHLYFTLSKDLPADATYRAVYGVGLWSLVCWNMGSNPAKSMDVCLL